MIFRIFLITLTLFPLQLLAQNKITGRVISNDNLPIKYANVYIDKSPIGTISNSEGFFELSIPENAPSKTIVTTCLGYNAEYYPLDSLFKLESRKLVLQLNPKSYDLQELTISQQRILKDPHQILSKAIEQLPLLLDPSPNIAKYYFRQTHRNDSSITRLIEAAISIYDPGISHDIQDCKINIDELKTSLDNRILDYRFLLNFHRFQHRKGTIKHSCKFPANAQYNNPNVQTSLIRFYDQRHASLKMFYIKTNMLRGVQKGKRKKSNRINPYFKEGRPIITSSFIHEHKFKLDSIISYNNEPVYKIKILPNKRYPRIKYQEHSVIPIGTIYIRMKDFAILNLDYGYVNNPKHKYFNGKINFLFRFKMQFKDYMGKLYLNYLYSLRNDYNHKFYLKEDAGSPLLIQELVNTEISTNQEHINRQINNLQWRNDQYEPLPYNEEFWEKHSTMLLTKEEQNLKDNLIKVLNKK